MRFEKATKNNDGVFEVHLKSERWDNLVLYSTYKDLEYHKITTNSKICVNPTGEGLVDVGVHMDTMVIPCSFKGLNEIAQISNNNADVYTPMFLPVYVDECILGIDIGVLSQILKNTNELSYGIARIEHYNAKTEEVMWEYRVIDLAMGFTLLYATDRDYSVEVLTGYTKTESWDYISGQNVTKCHYKWKEMGKRYKKEV